MILITYTKSAIHNQSTSVKLRLEHDSDEVGFEVYLEGLEIGYDVTVNWKCHEMQSGGVFYTDSNALEIVKRTADDYTARYNTTTNQRASSNYYPINSAILIEDAGEQMVVMNDRSQGGSAYFDNGRIELMMNRRGSTSDDLGHDEPLDEREMIDD